MTRAEIIAALKEAKEPFKAFEAQNLSGALEDLNAFTNNGSYLAFEDALTHKHPFSITYAISLVEREKPGWGWLVTTQNYDEGRWQGEGFRAHIYSPVLTPAFSKASGPTPAIALVIALIGGE